MPTCHCAAIKGRGRCDIAASGAALRCCWCADERPPAAKSDPEVYIDGVGRVRPAKYGLAWPEDVGYCPRCRRSRVSSAVLYERLSRAIALVERAMA